jgi:hypothetical protein
LWDFVAVFMRPHEGCFDLFEPVAHFIVEL